jgi:hypothetical protein
MATMVMVSPQPGFAFRGMAADVVRFDVRTPQPQATAAISLVVRDAHPGSCCHDGLSNTARAAAPRVGPDGFSVLRATFRENRAADRDDVCEISRVRGTIAIVAGRGKIGYAPAVKIGWVEPTTRTIPTVANDMCAEFYSLLFGDIKIFVAIGV